MSKNGDYSVVPRGNGWGQKPMPRRATIPQATVAERYRSTAAMDGFVTRTRSLQHTTRATSGARRPRAPSR